MEKIKKEKVKNTLKGIVFVAFMTITSLLSLVVICIDLVK